MRNLVLGAAMGLAVLASSSIASAQSFGVYVGPPAPYAAYDDGYYYSSPRYRYRPRVQERTIVTRPAGRCGMYRFWDGETCVDARDR